MRPSWLQPAIRPSRSCTKPSRNIRKFILVVEGGIPTKDGGIYCKIAGKTAMDILAEVGPKAAAIIAIGTCATFGGVQAASPNPTGSVGVRTW